MNVVGKTAGAVVVDAWLGFAQAAKADPPAP